MEGALCEDEGEQPMHIEEDPQRRGTSGQTAEDLKTRCIHGDVLAITDKKKSKPKSSVGKPKSSLK